VGSEYLFGDYLRLSAFFVQCPAREIFHRSQPSCRGWDQLDWAEFVLVLCTEMYYRRFRGLEEALLADDAGDPELGVLEHALLFKKLPRPARKGGSLFQTAGLLKEELLQLRLRGVIEGAEPPIIGDGLLVLGDRSIVVVTGAFLARNELVASAFA
jgi:hypothetical protein